LLSTISHASDVFIESQGWFLFGGNSLPISQKLSGFDLKWQDGPAVINKNIVGQCVVEVKPLMFKNLNPFVNVKPVLMSVTRF